MASGLSPGEEAQLAQTVEMFEVITQSQPNDYQSLEILKEAYSKLGREKEVVNTAKRIAAAYVQMGQLSSAILEYETILQRHPDDSEVQSALKQIETKANNFPVEPPPPEPVAQPVRVAPAPAAKAAKTPAPPASPDIDDGRIVMHKIFVQGKIISQGDFDMCWATPDLLSPPAAVIEPFIQVLAEKNILPVDKSLKILADKYRAAYLPLNSYEIDMELARTFPAQTCRRWCVLPFDRLSKSILVATANPFNKQAEKELANASSNRLVWYLAPPSELVTNLRKAFR